MKNTIGRIIILVEDYDEAAAFYETNFGFKRLFDYVANGQRFLHVGTDAPDAAGIWFLQSANHAGKQTSGEPLMVLYTTDIEALYSKLKSNSVDIPASLVKEADYHYFYCLDLYGNQIIVTELK